MKDIYRVVKGIPLDPDNVLMSISKVRKMASMAMYTIVIWKLDKVYASVLN